VIPTRGEQVAIIGLPISVLDPTYATLSLDVEPSDTIENVRSVSNASDLLP
jgi:hypothetical protein